MKTLFNEQARGAILSRIHSVTADSQPRWGKMNAERMLTHLVESMRMTIGELVPKPRWLPIRYPPLRQLLVYWLPWPKGLPTGEELMPSNPRTMEESKRELTRLLAEIGTRAAHKKWPEHPAFGKLSGRGWGVLGWRHIDHHLRQFGA